MTRKFLAGLALMLIAQPLMAQNKTRDGAVLGGVGGAVLGGIIGHQNDETPEGALIGGAVGAVAGGLIGNARDKQLERDRYYQQQQWNQYQSRQHHAHTYNTYRTVPTRTTVVPIGVSIADVLSMTRNGVGESVVVNHIYTSGVQRRIDTNEIIMLHQQGVTENIINAMQQAPLRSQMAGSTYSAQGQTTIVNPPGSTVIVQEPIYNQPMQPSYNQPGYNQPGYNQSGYRQLGYNQPPYSQPTYARPSNYQNYPQRRGF